MNLQKSRLKEPKPSARTRTSTEHCCRWDGPTAFYDHMFVFRRQRDKKKDVFFFPRRPTISPGGLVADTDVGYTITTCRSVQSPILRRIGWSSRETRRVCDGH